MTSVKLVVVNEIIHKKPLCVKEFELVKLNVKKVEKKLEKDLTKDILNGIIICRIKMAFLSVPICRYKKATPS